MAQVRQQPHTASQPPQQIPTLPDVARFQSSPSKNVPGTYNPQVNGLYPYAGPHPQQISNHPSAQMVNRPPLPLPPLPQNSNYPSAQMGIRPPTQVSNHQSAQMDNRPRPQVSNHPSAQMVNRPPPQMVNYLRPQASNHPSAQMVNRSPPQMVNYPPPQISNHPSAQMSNRPPFPPPTSNHPSAQMGNRLPPQMVNYPPPQVSNHSSAQMVSYPPSQVSSHPSGQMGNRPPPQMANYPPPQVSSHPSAQIPSYPSSQISKDPSVQMGNRRPSRLTDGLDHNSVFDGSNNAKHDPLTGAIINTTTSNNNNNGNHEQSHNFNPSFNRVTSGEPEIPLVISPPLSESLFPFQHHYQHELPMTKYNDRDESSGIRTVSDDDILSVASMNKQHLPVFARFPFDTSFLSQPMDTSIEDSLHDLRHRIIESELNHQRRTNDDYIKRTHRIGIETDPEIQLDQERQLEIQKIQASLKSGRRSQQPLVVSNYSYEPHFHMQPLSEIIEDRYYSSSNMDDLIDAMARRHLADRRYDASADHRRSGMGGYSPYFESSPIGRRVPLRSQQRNEDIYFANTTPTSYIEHDHTQTSPNDINSRFRPAADHRPLNPSDLDVLGSARLTRSDSSPKLPPISLGRDSHRSNRSQYGLTSTLYQTKHNLHGYRNYQQSVPLGLPDHSEHLIELPSDIFLTTGTEPVKPARRHRSIRRTKPKTVRRHKSNVSEDSETDSSDNENDFFSNKHRHHRSKHGEDQQGFFTERNPEPKYKNKSKHRRQLFRKAIMAVLFINALKHRANKNRSKNSRQTLSATIHKIRLQEIMVALHRVYLEPEGPIYNALIQSTMSSVELKNALNTSSKYYSDAISVIGDALNNIISKIVDFMPKDGVLGTSKTSAISALIQDGNPFPDNYFWQCERELLEFNKSRLINITKQRAMLLLIGSFIFRALVTTLLTKPIKYRLLLGQLTPIQSASLKVLASVIFYVGRRVVTTDSQILPLPHEWSLSLHSDTDIKPIVQHSEIKPIITACEKSLRSWCEQYIRRIDASFGRELRA